MNRRVFSYFEHPANSWLEEDSRDNSILTIYFYSLTKT